MHQGLSSVELYVCGERVFKKKLHNCVGHKAVICSVMIDGSRFFDVVGEPAGVSMERL